VTEALSSFAGGAGAFAAYALAVPVVLRLPGRASPVARQAGLALVVHAAAVLAAPPWLESWSYWHGAALYWCCFAVALFGHGAVYKSVSLGILGELARQDDHGLGPDRIAERFVWPGFAARARLLVAAGYAEEAGGRFRLTEAGRRLARRVRAVQRLFGVTRSGLYDRAA